MNPDCTGLSRELWAQCVEMTTEWAEPVTEPRWGLLLVAIGALTLAFIATFIPDLEEL